MAYASRRSSYLAGSLGAFVQVLGLCSIFFSTLLRTVDIQWDMAHVAFYVGFAVTVLAVWRGLRVPRMQPATVPINFANTAGLKLMRAGLGIEIVGLALTEFTQQLVSDVLSTFLLSIETVGFLTIALGIVVGLTIEFGLIRREIVTASALKRLLTFVSVVLMFASIWLAAASFFLHLATLFRTQLANIVTATFLALVAPLVLVPAKRVLPGFGSALSVGIVFGAVSYFFVGIARTSLYIPWGLLPLVLFEISIFGLKRAVNVRKADLGASMVLGLLFWATYYPLTSSLFPWSSSPQPPLLAVVLGSLAGAMLGNAAFAAITSAVLGNVLG